MNSSVDRRTFITTGAVAVVGLASVKQVHAAPAEGSPLLSVGILQPASGVARRFGARASFAAAEKITTSDPSLTRTGAQLSIEGLWLPETDRVTTLTIGVDALYTPEPEMTVPVKAWTYSRKGSIENRGGRSVFTSPVGKTLDFDILHSVKGNGRVSFSVLPQKDSLMLNRGVYVIAFQPASGALPDWSDIRMNPGVTPRAFSSRPDGLLHVQGIGREIAPWFEYLVLSVDARA